MKEAPDPGAPCAEDRHVSAYSTQEKVARMLWAVVQGTLYRWSFHTWNRWRIFLLGRFGANVHPTCIVRRSSRVECPWNLTMGRNCCLGDRATAYCLGPVTLGDRVSVSQDAYLCAGSHDSRRVDLPLTRPPIRVGDEAWIAAGAFVGPGVTVGEGAVIGARAAVFRDAEAWTIYLGNPAQAVKKRELGRGEGAR